MREETLPQMAFLGFADHSEHIRDAGTNLLKCNVLGLRSIVLFNFLPVAINGLRLGLALRDFDLSKSLLIVFRDESGETIGTVKISLMRSLPGAAPSPPVAHCEAPFLRHPPQAWVVHFLPLPPNPAIVVHKPARYFVILQSENNEEQTIGEFYCGIVDPPRLTPELVAAIKSHPRGPRAVRAVLGCAKCPTQLRVYAALERDPQLEAEGFTWYTDIAEYFACECGATKFDTSTYKRNFFASLLQPVGLFGEVSTLPLYERSSVESLLVEFVNLLSANPLEEVLQKFIERNPILLHQFPAQRLFFKPAILTRFNADFAVVTPEKELILIEIERANTRLLKSDGGQHSELTHAIDQIHDWLGVTRYHLLAVLDESLQIPHEMVSTVRGVVIAGRDLGNDPDELRALKARYRGEVKLLTYDDLSAGLASLAQNLGK